MRYSIWWDYVSVRLPKDVSAVDFVDAIEKKIFFNQKVEREDFYIFLDPLENVSVDESLENQLNNAGFAIIPLAVFNTDGIEDEFLTNFQLYKDSVHLALLSNRLSSKCNFFTRNSHKCHVIQSSKDNNDVKWDCKSYLLDDFIQKNDNSIGGEKISDHEESESIDLTNIASSHMDSSNISYPCMIKFCPGKENEVSEFLKTQLKSMRIDMVYIKNGVGMLEFFSEEDSKNALHALENVDRSLKIQATLIDASGDQQECDGLSEGNNDEEGICDSDNESIHLNFSSSANHSFTLMKPDRNRAYNRQRNRKFFLLLNFKKTHPIRYYLSEIKERLGGITARPMYIDSKSDWGVLGFSSADDRRTALIRLEFARVLDGSKFNPHIIDRLPRHLAQRMREFYRSRNSRSTQERTLHSTVYPRVVNRFPSSKSAKDRLRRNEKENEDSSCKNGFLALFVASIKFLSFIQEMRNLTGQWINAKHDT